MSEQPEVNREYGLSSKEMLGMPRKDSLENAQLLLQGELALNITIHEHIPFSMESFDWTIRYSQSPTTVQMLLQGLTPVSFLVGGYVISRNIEMYRLAGSFIRSWIQFCPEVIEVRQGAYEWDQHSAAFRTEALLYYLLVGVEDHLLGEEEVSVLQETLERHGAYLGSEQYYLCHENHGVLMDRALLYVGYAFHNTGWSQLAVERLWEQWCFLFGENGVCVENSYAYQWVNRELFLEVARVLHRRDGGRLAARLWQGLLKAEEFMGYALLPDGCSPSYGDSPRSSYMGMRTMDRSGVLAYAVGNQSDTIPEKTSVVYPREGYYFGREFWKGHVECGNQLLPRDSFWIMLRSGYQSLTHRQADDNSFMLYARGCDVFTDSGLYNYMFRDPMRQYVRSANAHNTVIVDGKSYDFLRQDCVGMSGVFRYSLNRSEGIDYVAAFSKLYCGVTHVRHFIYAETDVLIVDELYSVSEHIYSQMFHCGREIRLLHADEAGSRLQIGEGGYQMDLRQQRACDSLETFHGEKEGVLYGNISEQFNESFPVDTLKFNRKGKRAVFVTQLSLLGPGENSISGLQFSVDMERGLIMAEKGGNSRVICSIESAAGQQLGLFFRRAIDQVEIRYGESGITFTLMNLYQEPMEYAWYLLEPDGKTVKSQQWYSDSPSYTVCSGVEGLAQLGETREGYIVRAFLRAKESGEKATQDVAKLFTCNGRIYAEANLNYSKKLEEWRPANGGA